MSYSTSSIIPFDSGRSYVVRDLPLSERTDYRFEDKMGRTEKDKTFLKQFEAIFLAASKGDLAGCERVVKEGFRDFRAYSIGRYGTGPNNRLDHVSPLQIAEQRGHATIVEFFKKIMNGSSLTSSPTSPGTLNPFGQLKSDGKELLSLLVEDKNFESNMAKTTHDSSFGPNKEIKPSNLSKQSTSSLSKNTFKNKCGIKCLESTPTSVFFEKPRACPQLAHLLINSTKL